MPWKECSVMEERLRFVARLLEQKTLQPLDNPYGARLSPIS